ncbi:MAG: ExeM/NucH family extracellular endonuclease [Cyanobacterium sp. T60_A2020_053]|nr:ExeM/NucH family extracellular endonuclease [Cyanobacterium sp. T60_A2020_053]
MTTEEIMTTLFTENFDNFLGQGFAPTPTAGQLDSDIWRATGFSDFTGAFGGSFTSGDSAMGADDNGGVITGGIYAFTTSGNTFLGVQPGGNDFTPGTITLKFTNTTGSTLTDLTVKYDIFFNNNATRANSLNFAYSLDDSSYIAIDGLDFTTPEAIDNLGFVSEDKEITITGLNIANNDNFFLQWQSDDVSGSGSRDEYGIDNIEITNASASGVGDIQITEFMYAGNNDEFVEFTNVGDAPVDMEGWSFDDDSRVAGTVNLSAFGTVEPGESVILTEASANAFRTAWGIPSTVKIIGGLTANLGRNDEINLFDQDNNLVDRLTYGDGDFSGTIRAQNISGWAPVTALDDQTIDSDWVLSTVNNVQNARTSTGGDVGSPGIFNTDDTFGAVLVESNGSTDVTEGGATDTYTLVLRSQPTADVTININPDSELTTDNNQVIFTSANWNIAQTITVTAVDDSDVEGNHTGTINHSVTSSDTNYNGISVASVTANITDNEATGIAPSIAVNVSTTTDLLDGGTLNLLPVSNSGAISGVINDPTDPARFSGIDFTIADTDTPINNLTVTAVSSNQGVVSDSNLNITQNQGDINLKITPDGVGFADITITVSDGINDDSYTINYGASGASVNPTTTTFLTGASDASTAIAIDSDYMLVADDEDQTIRLYSRTNSGAPLNAFDFTSSLGLTDLSGGVPREVDIEASSKLNNTIYWMGSHSNNSSGNDRPNRERIFATTISNTGLNTTLTFDGFYQFLEDDLIAWDNNNGHGLGAGFLGLASSSANGVIPESSSLNGFNIEGLTFAPNDTTAYVSFRAPNLPTTDRQDALIVPVTNFTNLLGQNSGSATFAAPIFLDLDGRGIRSIERNNTGEYLIVAGPADQATGTAPKDFRLYTWDGDAQNAPILKDADLTGLNSGGSFESIVEVPDNLDDADIIPLLVDNGDTVWYDNGVNSKNLSEANQQKFRQEFIQLSTPITKIHEIQGNSTSQLTTTFGRNDGSALEGQSVKIQGVVTAVYPQLNAFFMQEEDSDQDGDSSTSEGIFVFVGSAPTVTEGNIVTVTGAVDEFFGMTQIDNDNGDFSITVDDSGNNLNLITPTQITLPATGDIDEFYEQYEGMKVQFTNKLVVSEYFELARFGQIVLTEGARSFQYTHIDDTPTVAENQAFLADLARKRIILDDDNNIQNITGTVFHPQPNGFGVGTQGEDFFRGGDAVNNLTGVLHWSFAGAGGTDAWRIRPTEANPVQFTVENPRPLTSPDVGGNVKVVSFNVLNYFNTIDNGSNGARGADSQAEFDRQSDKLIQALIELDADVLGLIELENNGDEAQPAIKELVERLNTELGSNIYDFVDAGKVGTDAITNGFIYKTSTMQMLGNPAILNDASFTDPNGTGQQRSRPAIAQTFRVIETNNDDFGESFNVVVNHFKSKGASGVDSSSPDADQGDGQGNWNDTRTKGAEALATWIATDPTGSGDEDYLIIGDLNAYKGETPITALKDAGYTDLIEQFNGNDAYSFVFNGQLGYLDHALGNSAMTLQVTDVADWFINSDEVPLFDYNDEIRDSAEASFEAEPNGNPLFEPNAFRTSDHNPVVVGLDLDQITPQNGTTGNDMLTGSPNDDIINGVGGRNIIMSGDGNDVLIGGQGPDRLTGGNGFDIFRYDSLVDIGDTITDFEVGIDKIDLSRVLLGIGYSDNDPLGDGVVINRDFRGNTILQIDPDGSGSARAVSFLRLQGVSAGTLSSADFIF